jgi:hypothetical protein
MEEWKVYKITYIGANQYTDKLKIHNIWEVSNEGNVKRNGILYHPLQKLKYLKAGGFFIHRAVAELFVPNPNNYPCVDHIDGDTHNNKAENLRWCTQKMNIIYSYSSSTTRRNNLSESLKLWWQKRKQNI